MSYTLTNQNSIIIDNIESIDNTGKVFLTGVLAILSDDEKAFFPTPHNPVSFENVIKIYFSLDNYIFINKDAIIDSRIGEYDISIYNQKTTIITMKGGDSKDAFCLKVVGEVATVSSWEPISKIHFALGNLLINYDRLSDARKTNYDKANIEKFQKNTNYKTLATPSGARIYFGNDEKNKDFRKYVKLSHEDDQEPPTNDPLGQ